MKKTFTCVFVALLSCFFFFRVSAVSAQAQDSIPYRFVVVEDFVGTWCSSCPEGADTLSSLLQSFDRLAILGHHLNESRADVRFLYHLGSYERSCYYDTIYSIPAVFLNGASVKKWNRLRAGIEDEMERKTPYDLRLEAKHFPLREVCRDSFEIKVKIERVAADAAERELRLYLCFTQDHLPFAWMNQTEVNHANTFMYPDGKGVKVALDEEGKAEFVFAFSTAYDKSHLLMNHASLTAFLQDSLDRTILQADVADFSKGELSVGVETPDFHLWTNPVVPDTKVQFFNNTFGENLYFLWAFDGAEPPSSNEPNPTVVYSKPGLYTVGLFVKRDDEPFAYNRENFVQVLDVKQRISVSPNPAKPKKNITLSLLSEADSCVWTTIGGDPLISYGKTATVKFSREGTYNLQVSSFFKDPSSGKRYDYDSLYADYIVISNSADNEQMEEDAEIQLVRIAGSNARYKAVCKLPIEYVEVFYADGKRVLRTSNAEFDLESYPRGVYAVCVKCRNRKPAAFKLVR